MAEKSPIKIDTAIVKTLKSLKEKWKMQNMDQVIDKLIKGSGISVGNNGKITLINLHKDCEDRIKTLEDRLQTSGQPHPAPPVENPTIDTSTEASKVTETFAPIEPVKVGGQQCYYHTFNPKKQLVGCMRKYEKHDVIEPVTQQICDKCWAQNPYKKYPIPNSQITDENQSLKGVSETSLITDEQISKEEPAPNSLSDEQKSESKPSSENEKWTSAQAKQIALAYEIWMAREKAKTEGERERQRIKTEEQAKRRGNSQKKSTIDMGDSAGVSEEYSFREG